MKPLPPLPEEYNLFINDVNLSARSRILNLIFSFASLESSHKFPPNIGNPESFVALQGKLYHRVRPDHANSGVRWLLHDGFMPEDVPYTELASSLPGNWISAVRASLLHVNPLVTTLINFAALDPHMYQDAQLTLHDSGAQEIAAVISLENTTMAQIKPRSLVIQRKSGKSKMWTIPTASRLWEPLSYPLLFPHGTLGWGVFNGMRITRQNVADSPSETTQMWYYRALLLREPRFQIFGRLANEYIIDMFSRDLETRLAYIRKNQSEQRSKDAELMGLDDVEASENIYLPSSFLGSNRWASEQIADSLAIAVQYGAPDFFVTITCNDKWPEIQSQLRPGQTFADIPIVVVRVFHRKLALFIQALKTMFTNIGRPVYIIQSIEFQKRGLPHAHILVKYKHHCITPIDIDTVVSAEIPVDPSDAALVRQFMIHKHTPTYCMREDRVTGVKSCRFKYPRPINQTTTFDADGRVIYRRRKAEDVFVVPHCLALLRKFKCHINFEVAGSSQLFQYIFKYIHKGTIIY